MPPMRQGWGPDHKASPRGDVIRRPSTRTGGRASTLTWMAELLPGRTLEFLSATPRRIKGGSTAKTGKSGSS